MKKYNLKLESLLKLIKYPLDSTTAINLYDKNQFTFLVDRSLTKNEIKYAIEKKFQAVVLKVNTSILPPKNKRVGKFVGKKAVYKKAILFLKSGHTLDKMLNYSDATEVSQSERLEIVNSETGNAALTEKVNYLEKL